MAIIARAQSWLFDVFTHHHAEQLRIQRAVQRKALGVDQQDFPYPGAVQITNTTTAAPSSSQPQPEPRPQGSGSSRGTASRPDTTGWLSSPLRAALLTAGCLLAGGGGAAGVSYLTRLASPVVSAPGAPASATPKPQEFDIQFHIEGGELKVDPPIPIPP
jgi:hypothetical protein